MKAEHITKEKNRINKRNDYAASNYGHIPTEELDLIVYINKTISDAIRIDYHEGICTGYRILALHYIMTDSTIDAIEILQKIERLIKAYDLNESFRLNLYGTYVVYYIEFTGDLNNGIKYAQKGLELADALNDKNMAIRLKSNLGVIYIQLGYFERAKEVLEPTLEYYLVNGDDLHAMYVYNNLAEVFLNMELVDKAKYYYQQALEIAKAKDDISIRIDATNGLSEIYTIEKHYTDAISITKEIIDYLKISKNIRYELEANIQLANIYKQQGMTEKAFVILNSLKDKIQIIENQTILIKYYDLYSKVAKELKEYKTAFDALEKYYKYYAYINDLKAEKAMNEIMKVEFKKTLDRLETIAKVGRELTTLTNIDDVLYDVRTTLSRLMEISIIGIGEIKGNVIEFNHFLIDGYISKQNAINLTDKNSLAAWSVNNNMAVQINDINSDYGLYVKEVIKAKPSSESKMTYRRLSQSILYAPLVVKDEIIGVFTIQSFNKNAFLSEEFEMFKIIVAYVAIAYKNITQSKILEKLSFKDSLTGTNNRLGFTEFYKSMTEKFRFSIYSISLIMLDLDNFKQINDKSSHLAGDEVLIEVAKLLMSKEVEESIISARLGGEEFGFILFNKNKQYVLEFAEVIRREIESLQILYDNNSIKVTASIGVTNELFERKTKYKQLYLEADKALLRAKKNGKNRVEFFEARSEDEPI